MGTLQPIRSVSFDTSFLLKDNPRIDTVIKSLARDFIPCFVTASVASEIEQLKIWGRISPETYKHAMKRWKQTHATVIDFKNRLLSDAIGRACLVSMEKHHGVTSKDIVNDCTILVSALKNGVDLFLSEDFHFTSAISKQVIDEVKNTACREFHQMCESDLYSIDAATFLQAYAHGKIDLDVVKSLIQTVQKPGKNLY